MELLANKIYTVEQTAEILSIRRETLLKLIYAKELQASKIGRLWRIQGSNIYNFLNTTSNVNIDDDNIKAKENEAEIKGQTTCFDFCDDEQQNNEGGTIYFDFNDEKEN